MSFVDKLLPKDKPSEYFLTLKLGIRSLQAIVWEVKNKKIVILGRGEEEYQGVSDLLEAADKAISEAEKNLSGILVEKVIFGLPLDFIYNNKIKPEILAELRGLKKKLQLTPLGFIELPEALAYFLKSREDTPTSAILLGLNTKTLAASLLRVGKIYESVTLPRSDNTAIDVEKALKSFTHTEILPSRILMYDEDENLEKVQEELIKHPWHQKGAFLHFPKIEIIKKEDLLKSLVESAAAKIITAVHPDEFKEEKAVGTPIGKPDKEEPATEVVTEKEESLEKEETAEKNELKSEEDAETFGFLRNQDIAVEQIDNVVEKGHEEEQDYEREEPSGDNFREKLHATNHLPKIPFAMPKFTMPNLGKFKLLPFIIIFLVLIFVGGGAYAYYQIPKASVKLQVLSKNTQKDMDITLDPNAHGISKDSLTIPAQSIETEVSGDKTASTSGKKNVGNPAKGTVTIYNKTTDGKTFPSGTVLTSNDLKFTLDSDVTIASASDTGEGLNYGKTDAKITASTIGPDSNLSGGTTFTFADFSSSSYSGKNNAALSGGTSRQISAVSQEDQNNLLSDLSSELKDKAKTALYQKLTSEDKILDESMDLNYTNKKFDKNVGSEGSNVALSLTAKISALSYKTADLNELVKNTITGDANAGFEFSPQNTKLKVNEVKPQKDGSLKISASVTASLLPRLPLDKIKKDLAGKSLSAAKDYLKTTENLAAVDINIESWLPFSKNYLPRKSSNIELSVSSQ